ncbi:MAG TPA: type I-B CRISPR-associated protein Cas7/Csh2 [Candidatus Ozemobacteraceae bacterium]|nr:type I-B CRISPR-associated protein Cas7/Csh2 [Candidatus Ozemobacteraceae bacterium]
MTTAPQTLSQRHEFLFLYDIKMGNPNGDPDENRPRVLPDGTHYVTDVRLKRFARDFFKVRNRDILVDSIEGRTTNLTGRVVEHLKKVNKPKADGAELVSILLDAFIDARLFGSSLAFKKLDKYEPSPEPKTLTGAVQINMGEVLHPAEEVDIRGTSVFASQEDNKQGTFTTYFGLRYALIGFSGIANEHSAKLSRLTDGDYHELLQAIWNGVRSVGNTRTKRGQMPHLLIDVAYKPGVEFQYGRLHDYVRLSSREKPEPKTWAGPQDYEVDLSLLQKRLSEKESLIEKVRVMKSSDLQLKSPFSLPSEEAINLELAL